MQDKAVHKLASSALPPAYNVVLMISEKKATNNHQRHRTKYSIACTHGHNHRPTLVITGDDKGATIRFPGGGGRSIFEINNFGRTLREINNLLQEMFHINM